MKYLAKLSYIGTAFHGFQIQPDKRTVQGVLSEAMCALFASDTKITGCSRTDSGVHATGFCVTIENERATIPPDKLALAAIPFLPSDLSIVDAIAVSEDFHVRYDVLKKEYEYLILNRRVPDPFLCDRVWFLPQPISNDGFLAMQRAAPYFLGKHDFSAFMAEGSDVLDTEREIYGLSVLREGDLIRISICADGFLYNMVRIIVGTLTEVAFFRINPDAIPKIIESKMRSRAGMTAPAGGLYLKKIVYKNGFSF